MKYFLYCRKSSESDDKQILSNESQYEDLIIRFGDNADIQIVDTYREAFSAKTPGRPLFNEMMTRIEKGEASGVIAWHPDRLARNSVDGGRIIFLVDTGILKDLRFSTYTFENTSQGKLMLSIVFGFSKYYVDSLSENVKRGNHTKVLLGWRPNMAPLGYLNDKETLTIVADPARFGLIRRLFELALTGLYSLRQLRDETKRWDLRTRSRKRSGGKHLSISMIHRMLRNPFYAGQLLWHGKVYPGAHQPMVTVEEFQQVESLLTRKEKQGTHHKTFAFTGLIHCGECGFMITAEDKINRHGTLYTYYHCTKRRLDYKCQQPFVRAHLLLAMLVKAISALTITTNVHDWTRSDLATDQSCAAEQLEQQRQRLLVAAGANKKSFGTLTTLRVREQIDDQEFAAQRKQLQNEGAQVQGQLEKLDEHSVQWFSPAESLIWFSTRAVYWLRDAYDEEKRLIVAACGSHLALTDKKLRFKARIPFLWIAGITTHAQLRAVLNRIRTLWIRRDPQLLQTLAHVRKVLELHREE
jgi:site-specific DNA recombinase